MVAASHHTTAIIRRCRRCGSTRCRCRCWQWRWCWQRCVRHCWSGHLCASRLRWLGRCTRWHQSLRRCGCHGWHGGMGWCCCCAWCGCMSRCRCHAWHGHGGVGRGCGGCGHRCACRRWGDTHDGILRPAVARVPGLLINFKTNRASVRAKRKDVSLIGRKLVCARFH